ncbi:ATP-grasp domain-containing protein [Leptospira ilyithenensis]|uniref:ATP-grasp domain-containing protein n=1 Tax=Leptospira ilyithenensis TaxID=2484901 RepID=A0A4R9LTT7_9LEPT|nr:ATP-grasp domain-containing protein [Leptospira ilyithenensis]TGN13978.1 ATP-grasp domain-containing protein [Leptospira ilyithenensis]
MAKKLIGSFISIGAGKNQLPLILAAKERGLHVIGIDKNSTAVGFSHCDIRILESTKEYRKILHAMSRVPMTEKLQGVATRSFGDATYSASYLSEKFKLIGNPSTSVSLFSNKKQIKSILEKKGILVPKTQTIGLEKKVTKKTELPKFPIIVKPSLGFAKRGIQIIEEEKAWTDLQKTIKSDQWIVESKIEGDEVTALGFIVSSKFYLLSLSDKITTKEPPFLEVAHITPSERIDMAGEIKMICQSIVNLTKLKNGPFVAEFKINSQGDCYLLESAPEVGGEFLAEQLLPKHYGYSYFSDLISLYLGEKPKPNFLHKPKGKAKKTAIIFRIPHKKQKLVGQEPELQLAGGESLFFKESLIPEGESLDKREGNARRPFVYGISTTSEVGNRDWIESIQDRMNG